MKGTDRGLHPSVDKQCLSESGVKFNMRWVAADEDKGTDFFSEDERCTIMYMSVYVYTH